MIMCSLVIMILVDVAHGKAWILPRQYRNMLDGICHATVPHQRSGSGAQGHGVTNGRPGN